VPFMINITHFRIIPSALASGHGRYITVTPERTIFSVGEWPLNISGFYSSWTPGAFYTYFNSGGGFRS
jgi:hypothetical protein